MNKIRLRVNKERKFKISKYRNALPQVSSKNIFITDGGIETDLIYHEGMELPSFASFVLLLNEKGTEALRKYFQGYVSIARNHEVGLILESATWRSNPDWGKQLGYSESDLAAINQKAVDMLVKLRKEYENDKTKTVSTELDEGNPVELAQDYTPLLNNVKNLNVLGGCCGTDSRHIEEICKVAVQHKRVTA